MNLAKLKANEVAGFDSARLKELSIDVSKEIANLRMDVYAEKGKQVGKVRGLRKSLARIKTAERLLQLKSEAGRA